MNKIIIHYNYMLKYLSKDLYVRILDFSFGKCEKCNIQKNYTDIINDCYLYNYLSIFDDDFNIQKPIKYYRLLCIECKKNYTKNKCVLKKIQIV